MGRKRRFDDEEDAPDGLTVTRRAAGLLDRVREAAGPFPPDVEALLDELLGEVRSLEHESERLAGVDMELMREIDEMEVGK